MGCEGTERLIVVEGTLRDVVRALPRRTGIGIIGHIVAVERRTHIEGIERGVVVVAQPAPYGKLTADLRLLLGQDIHAGDGGIVVEGIPVEVLHVVAHNERLQVLTLQHGACVYLLTGAWQDKRLQVVSLSEGLDRQLVVRSLDREDSCRRPFSEMYENAFFHNVGIVEVEILQVSQVVACLCPRAVAGQVAQQIEVGSRDGTDNLQACDA